MTQLCRVGTEIPKSFAIPEAVPRRVSAATWSPQRGAPLNECSPFNHLSSCNLSGGIPKFATLIRYVDADNLCNTNRLVRILAFDRDGRDNLDARGNGFNVRYVNRSPNP